MKTLNEVIDEAKKIEDDVNQRRGRFVVRVDYTYGFSSLPADVKEATDLISFVDEISKPKPVPNRSVEPSSLDDSKKRPKHPRRNINEGIKKS